MKKKILQIERAEKGFVIKRSWIETYTIANDIEELTAIIRETYED